MTVFDENIENICDRDNSGILTIFIHFPLKTQFSISLFVGVKEQKSPSKPVQHHHNVCTIANVTADRHTSSTLFFFLVAY